MKISVIIPIYNVEEYVERCITSVLRQTYADIEIILVEDCSTDRSKDIVLSLISSNTTEREIRLMEHSQNRGLSAARNTGIKNATGDFIFFIDSDDDLPINAFENLVKPFMKDSRLDMITGRINQIGPEQYRTTALSIDFEKVLSGEQIFKKFLKQEWPGMACNVLVRKSIIENNHLLFKEGIVHEDTLWSYNLFQKVNKVVCINQETYNYYLKEGSITTSKKSKNYDSILVIIKEIIKAIERNEQLRLIPEHSDFLSDIGFYFFKEINRSALTKEERREFYKEMHTLIKYQLEIFPKQTLRQRLKRLPYYLPFACVEQLIKLINGFRFLSLH